MADDSLIPSTPQVSSARINSPSAFPIPEDPGTPPTRSRFQKLCDALAQRNLYDDYEPVAKTIKIMMQMSIGIILVCTFILNVLAKIFYFVENTPLRKFAELNPLNIAAYGLFFSAGIDLAYMLFTDGPDEALDPIMAGVAGAILLGVAQINADKIQEGITLFLETAALAGLFAVRLYLFNKNRITNKEKQP
jgi:hypothetical protein